MIRAISHGRVGIIGNPTDGYGGAMIACSTKNYAEAVIQEHDELVIENEFGKKVLRWENDFSNQGDYFDIVRSVLRYFKLYDLKAKIVSHSNIPVQAGLAGSTAVLSSTLSAIAAYTGQKYNLYQLAELNRVIELHYLKCHCGYQDAYMTTFGGLNFLDFRGKQYYKDLDKEQYATVERISNHVGNLPFIVAHTGIKHHSGNFHKPLRERWLEGDATVVDGYNEIVNIAREGKKAMLNHDWKQLAYLMNSNHNIQDSLCDSGEQNRYMIGVAMKNGAMAAKLAGAGGGGTIIILPEDKERVIRALQAIGAEEFIELDHSASGVTVDSFEESQHYVAATAEQ